MFHDSCFIMFYLRACVYACVYVRVFVRLCTCVRAFMYVYACVYVRVSVRVCVDYVGVCVRLSAVRLQVVPLLYTSTFTFSKLIFRLSALIFRWPFWEVRVYQH